jgi:DNA-binding response OmpR family regulator
MIILLAAYQDENQDGINRILHRHGHDIITVDTGVKALEQHSKAEMVLLDLDLPDVDGIEVCRNIRQVSDTPIITFTTRGADLDRVLSLQVGADDCLDKPYIPRELLARMEAIMRRVSQPAQPAQRTISSVSLPMGDVCVNVTTRQAHLNGEPLRLTRKEFDLLHYLVRHPDSVVTRKEIMTEIWDDASDHAQTHRASRTIDTHVSSLRRKLGDSASILAIRGIGFRIGLGERTVSSRIGQG